MSRPFERYDLEPTDIAVLIAAADTCYYTLGKHVAEQAILKRCNKNIKSKDIRKSFKKLCTQGLILKHPTGRNVTYNISREGLAIAAKNVGKGL
jgi:predicted transcriptional regulator